MTSSIAALTYTPQILADEGESHERAVQNEGL